MTEHETPYSVLGLRPGAGRDEIDDAYRRLIKRHHPDYTGGDGDRAAEINRAYYVFILISRQPQR
ncbi:MAG: J domain-containing protein, partial [Sphingomonas sp.]|nr:J domain-containing protein [Sphingomonas sp.]